MAVYKATFCSPLLNSVDPRVAPRTLHKALCEWIKCKIDSSNTQITGYSIRLLTQSNEQVFPVSNPNKISPISELKDIWDDEVSTSGYNINVGLNGTMLHIPFFQNSNYNSLPANNQTVLRSYNAIYYTPLLKVEYVDELSGWTVLSSGVIQNTNWDGKFNGEVASAGDLVLCSTDDTDTSGVWEVHKDGTLHRTENLSEIQSGTILVTNGSDHNKIYKFESSSWIVDQDAALWEDIEGYPIDLSVDGVTYKWEITLYQGNGIVSGSDIKEISYPDLNYEWFDMILNSGTILGSTEKRLQIADSDRANAKIPAGTFNDPLVLQGNYVQLFGSNGQQISRRAYIRNYDTTYGHIYPEENAFQLDLINTAIKIKCYKHSNDPDAVLSGEKVAVATLSNINLSVAPTSTTQIDGYTVKFGDWVLVKDQNDAKENGIYISDSAGWSRAGSYNSWGDFIGAIIFVENGVTNGGKNWESLASVNGSLYVEGDVTSGDSPLYFKEETPIVLFPDKIDYSVDLIQETDWSGVSPSDTNTIVSSNSIDGIQISTGYKIAVLFSNQQWGIRTITSCNYDQVNDEYNITWTINESSISEEKIIYSNNGKKFGKSCIKPSLLDPYYTLDESSYSAVILKNTATKTYISPYLNLRKDMALKLSNGKTVTYSDYSVSPWIRITSVNPIIWYITHDAFITPLLSSSNTLEGVPYVYTVRSYFKSSDENPFYVYETPYLKIGDQNGAGLVTTYEQFTVYNSLIQEAENFVDSNSLLFHVRNLGLASIQDRYVTLYGFYKQFQQLSWESYRWKLLNSRGLVIQDTGDRFDKEMKTTFYGLSNETENYQNIYYAILYVTDSAGNNLSTGIELIVDGSGSDIEVGFSVQYECDTHSIILSYQDNAYFAPSITKDDYAYRDSPTNLATYQWGFWDESYTYTKEDDEDVLWITGEDSSMEATLPDIYAVSSETINVRSGLSGAAIFGLEYSHYFPINEDRISENGSFLEVIDNSLSFETEIKLDANYNGHIASISVEGPSDGNNLKIEFKTADNFENGHKLNDLNANRNELNVLFSTNSKTFTDSIKTYVNNSVEGVQLFTIPQSGHSYFIMQCNDTVTDEDGEYHAFKYGTNEEYSVWYHTGVVDNSRVYLNSHKPYGNCCLISNAEVSVASQPTVCSGAPIYWAENRGTVHYLNNNSTIAHVGQENVNLLASDSNYDPTEVPLSERIPSWPGNNEDSLYWMEQSTDPVLVSYPTRWSLVHEPINNIIRWTARKRHPNLTDKWLYFHVVLTDVDSVYAGIENEQCSLADPTAVNPNKMAILIGSIEYGYIEFEFREHSN